MLGLPENTELHKSLPKKVIYTKFQMNSQAREKLDLDISRITIVNEVTTDKINVEIGNEVKSFYVMHILLKKSDFNEKNIILISKLIPQKMLLVLEYAGLFKIAVFHTKLIQTDWKELDELSIDLEGLNLDTIWENIIIQIGNVNIIEGNTLEEQIIQDEKRQKLLKEIEQLEKKARAEKQAKKKFELVQQLNKLKTELGGEVIS